MPSTTNFGWTTPADTDLVKDGAAAIRTLGNGIDTSFLDLKGGTSGQVLAKNSNTDLDFTWVAQDDSNAIQNAIVDAKGDLISATAADTPARLASSGVNGEVLTIDTSTSTGLKWATPAAGGMTLISTTTLSGASTNITSIPTTYKNLQFICRDIGDSGTTTRISFRPNNNSGIGYYTAGNYGRSTGVAAAFEYNATLMRLDYTQPADSNTPWYSVIDVYDYASTTSHKLIRWTSAYINGGDYYYETAMTYFPSDSAITSATFASVSGTALIGSVLTYGVS